MKSFDIFSVYLPGPCPSIFPISCFHSKQIYMKNIIKSSITSLSMIYCQTIYPKNDLEVTANAISQKGLLTIPGPLVAPLVFPRVLVLPKANDVKRVYWNHLDRPSVDDLSRIYLFTSINKFY